VVSSAPQLPGSDSMHAPTRTIFALMTLALASVPSAHAWGGGGGKPNEFDPATMSTPAQAAAVATKYWKGTGLRKIRAAGYKKAAIVEFSVEYVTLTKSDWTGHGNF